MSDLEQLEAQGVAELATSSDEQSLIAWNQRWFGKTGLVSLALKKLTELPGPERKAYGQAVNKLKEILSAAFAKAQALAKERALELSIATEQLDPTLPGKPWESGSLHPATITMRRILAAFGELGYEVYHSREVEDDETNFGMLNMPPHHPARDMWDTFHTTDPGLVLRTHTSPGQIHAMRERAPNPLRVVLPGLVYRYEQITARSEIMFHQVEGLCLGENIGLTDLLGTLEAFIRRLFGPDRKVRVRSSYFPFTEPSIEVDMDCILCSAKGCPVCKRSGWLEILGAGMVHPVVLRNGGYDPDKHAGFAFGLGVERINMLLYGIEDIRAFWSGDLRFLRSF